MRKNASDLSPPTTAVVCRISDAEWVVLQVVWDHGTVSANEVVTALEGRQDWKPKTIHTLLRRLVEKGALDFEKAGREHLFRARIDREAAEKAQSRSFISRVFEGKATPFLVRFLESETFSADEIEELKRILESKQP